MNEQVERFIESRTLAEEEEKQRGSAQSRFESERERGQ